MEEKGFTGATPQECGGDAGNDWIGRHLFGGLIGNLVTGFMGDVTDDGSYEQARKCTTE